MVTEQAKRIRSNPRYQELVRQRNRFGWFLTILVLIVYYGFILIIAFDKQLLAQPLSPELVTTVGIPVGFGVILFSVVVTGIYVRRANAEYDRRMHEILEEEMTP